jgi:hypothetical protein
MRNVARPLIVAVLFMIVHDTQADGFSHLRAREQESHVVLQLSPEQVAVVGRERKLVLTTAQRENLARFAPRVPEVLGVESVREPDCSCCISSAMWTDTNEVTIWIERLARDRDGSKLYYECRAKPDSYTMDAEGRIFSAGQPVSWRQFQAAVLSTKEGEYTQLSRPPKVPSRLEYRMAKLMKQKVFLYRL